MLGPILGPSLGCRAHLGAIWDHPSRKEAHGMAKLQTSLSSLYLSWQLGRPILETSGGTILRFRAFLRLPKSLTKPALISSLSNHALGEQFGSCFLVQMFQSLQVKPSMGRYGMKMNEGPIARRKPLQVHQVLYNLLCPCVQQFWQAL